MKQLSQSSIVCAVFFNLLASIHATHAGRATWNSAPTSGDWNTAANWTPATVPNGPADIAEFGVSSTTDVALSGGVEVSSIQFDAGASAFEISVPLKLILTISGAGVINNSGITQHFVADFNSQTFDTGTIYFTNAATAGASVVYTNKGGGGVAAPSFLTTRARAAPRF